MKKKGHKEIEFKGKNCDDDKYYMCKTGRQGMFANTLLFTCIIHEIKLNYFMSKIGKPCALPWKYGNDGWYEGCADPNGKQWCPTEVNNNNTFWPKDNHNTWNNNWGYCDEICLNTTSKYLKNFKYVGFSKGFSSISF